MAMNVGTNDEGSAMADINVTPLVDVMLVLLIIFIITIPVIVAQVHLTLPKATNLPADETGERDDFGRPERRSVLEHQEAGQPR